MLAVFFSFVSCGEKELVLPESTSTQEETVLTEEVTQEDTEPETEEPSSEDEEAEEEEEEEEVTTTLVYYSGGKPKEGDLFLADAKGIAGDAKFSHLKKEILCTIGYPNFNYKNADAELIALCFLFEPFGLIKSIYGLDFDESDSHLKRHPDQRDPRGLFTKGNGDTIDSGYTEYDGKTVDNLLRLFFNVRPSHSREFKYEGQEPFAYYENRTYYSLQPGAFGIEYSPEVLDYSVEPFGFYTFHMTNSYSSFVLEDYNESMGDYITVKARPIKYNGQTWWSIYSVTSEESVDE